MLRTLIVEDNRIFRELLKEILTVAFPTMHVEAAADSAEALQKMDTLAPNVVFMDIGLAEENGLVLTKKIRATGWAGVIIVLTSHESEEYREAAFSCGANHFLTKSTLTRKEICSTVQGVMQKSHVNVPA